MSSRNAVEQIVSSAFSRIGHLLGCGRIGAITSSRSRTSHRQKHDARNGTTEPAIARGPAAINRGGHTHLRCPAVLRRARSVAVVGDARGAGEWVVTPLKGDCERCGYGGGWLQFYGVLCATYAFSWLPRSGGVFAFRVGVIAVFDVGLLVLFAFEPWAVQATFRRDPWVGRGLGAVPPETEGVSSLRVVVGWGAVLATWAFTAGLLTSAVGVGADVRRTRMREKIASGEAAMASGPK